MKLASLPPGAVRAAIPVVTVVAAVTAGVLLGVEIALLVVASGALLGVVALLWASVQSLTGEAPLTLEEALGLGAPSAEEEQKRAILRALKDLEFERSVGKISEEDYADLSARFREDAKRLMQALDQSSSPARERVAELVAERLVNEKRDKKRALAARAERRAADEAESEEAESPSSEAGSQENEAAPEEPAPTSTDVASTPVPREAGSGNS